MDVWIQPVDATHFNGDLFNACGTLGWRHASGYVDPRSVIAFNGSDPFTVQSVPMARNALVVDAGLMLQVTNFIVEQHGIRNIALACEDS